MNPVDPAAALLWDMACDDLLSLPTGMPLYADSLYADAPAPAPDSPLFPPRKLVPLLDDDEDKDASAAIGVEAVVDEGKEAVGVVVDEDKGVGAADVDDREAYEAVKLGLAALDKALDDGAVLALQMPSSINVFMSAGPSVVNRVLWPAVGKLLDAATSLQMMARVAYAKSFVASGLRAWRFVNDQPFALTEPADDQDELTCAREQTTPFNLSESELPPANKAVLLGLARFADPEGLCYGYHHLLELWNAAPDGNKRRRESQADVSQRFTAFLVDKLRSRRQEDFGAANNSMWSVSKHLQRVLRELRRPDLGSLQELRQTLEAMPRPH